VFGYGIDRLRGDLFSDSEIDVALDYLLDIEGPFIPVDDWLTRSALSSFRVPAGTSPGVRSKRLGFRTKRDALLPALLEASVILERMKMGEEKYRVPPCGVAGRGKRIDIRTAKVGKQGRLIVIPDIVRHLMGQLGSRPMMRLLYKFNKERGGVLLGWGPFSGNYQKIASWCEGATGFMFLDFKKFDQTVPARLIEAAFAHIRIHFSECPGSTGYWASEYEQLVNTEIVLPDGSVYRKDKGVASGDPWTSVVGSYVNWLVLHICLFKLRGKVDFKIWTFGDDSIVCFYGTPTGLEELSRLVAQWGMEVSPEKSYITESLATTDPNPSPGSSGSFLSNYFLKTPMGVRPTRPLSDLIELMSIPEANVGTVEWEVIRTAAMYVGFYYNPVANSILRSYWEWLHTKFKIPDVQPGISLYRVLRENDIPWEEFNVSWLARLPEDFELELLYRDGHTDVVAPCLLATIYRHYPKLSLRVFD